MSIDFIEQIKQDIRDDAVKEYKEEIKQSLEAEGLNQEKIERILKI